jgi:uncharacterized protein with von Willebrand factor type A (vWA) domain
MEAQFLTEFGRLLRRRGLPVGTGRILSFYRAAAALSPLSRHRLYWAGRITLVAHPDHFPIYDRAFDAYFRSPIEGMLEGLIEWGGDLPSPPEQMEVEVSYGSVKEADGSDGEEEVARLVASGVEILRQKPFEKLSVEERRATEQLVRQIAVRVPHRPARRLRPDRRGERFDLKRTLRASMRTHGEPFRRAFKGRRIRSRPLLLLLDVSGSMTPYARALMQFGYAAMGAGTRVEVFCFGTRLTRVTRALRLGDPDRALEDTSARVPDWSGGTRIGDCLKELIDDYAFAPAVRGSVAVLCSDGLERGDPDRLAAQMARLGRLAFKVVWVNPLKGDPRYQPLARGMAAALPHIDVFLPGHNIASLEALAEVVST